MVAASVSGALPPVRAMAVSAFAAREQIVLLSKPYRLDAALDRIVVYFNASVIDEARQAVPMVEGVADGFAQTGLLRDFQQPRLEPGFEVLDQWPGVGLPHCSPMRRRQTADTVLDSVEHRDPLQRFRGIRLLRRDVTVPELPPRMREAERQLRQTAAVLDQALVGGIAVDLQDAVGVPEQPLGAARPATA